MWLFALVYTAGLVLHHGVLGAVVDGWPGVASRWCAVLVCWLAARRARLMRVKIALVAAALTAQSGADTLIGVLAFRGVAIPFLSPADVGYVVFCAGLLTAVLVTGRRELAGTASSAWLDILVGSLGASSVLAVVLAPVWAPALTAPTLADRAVAVAYPLLDLFLVAATAGIAAARGSRTRTGRGWLAVGMAFYAGTDVLYALQRTDGTFVPGRLLDIGCVIAIAMIAMLADRAARTRTVESVGHHERMTRWTALAVRTAATAAAVGVLVMGTRIRVSSLAVTLAAGILVTATARTLVAYRQLARMAHLRRLESTTDPLTGLANRRALIADAHTLLTRPEATTRALLLLDLDKFKDVNDELGHHAGDQLLVDVAARMRHHLRPGDLLARPGGDEFAALLEQADRAQALTVAGKLRYALAAPITVAGSELRPGVSIGIAVFPDDGEDLSTLLRSADVAMYQAKLAGGGCRVFDASPVA
ncbi:cyclic di-GMP phosphodiesterase Gmr [mine drainage metagenome]|uniref:Cyclic di-GMP phosphodiesterase Gmr n=1 Tax=mine drainage metagenome TaxID=410659 RepID=A0A1J5QS65_9ZZZZ